MPDQICLACEHGPHRSAPCSLCGCKNWINTAVRTGQALTSVNNFLTQEIPKVTSLLVDIAEILAELHPEAVARIDARRKELRDKLEKELGDKEEDSKRDDKADILPTTPTD